MNLTFDLAKPLMSRPSFYFFFNDTATTEIYTLSLHDALPICKEARPVRLTLIGDTSVQGHGKQIQAWQLEPTAAKERDRKSTRLNSSHQIISYAVFCLKKKIRQAGPSAT